MIGIAEYSRNNSVYFGEKDLYSQQSGLSGVNKSCACAWPIVVRRLNKLSSCGL